MFKKVCVLSSYDQITKIFGAILITLYASALYAEESEWKIDEKSPVWARDAGTIASTLDDVEKFENSASLMLEHTGTLDWAIRLPQRIAVEPGEIFNLSCQIKLQGKGSAETGVILYDGNDPIHWSYGGKTIRATDRWTRLESTFIVPRNVTAIEPRLIGYESSVVWLADYRIAKTGKINLLKENRTLELDNEFLNVSFQTEDGSFSVLDKRTNRRWRQTRNSRNAFILSADKPSENQIVFDMLDGRTSFQLRCELTLCENAPELTVVLQGDPNQETNEAVFYPYAFESRAGDRVVLPLNEGISFPVEERTPGVRWLYTYGGHGLCMAFWGQIEVWGQIEDRVGEIGGSGFLGIIETPDDAAVVLEPTSVEKESDATSSDKRTYLLCSTPAWETQKGRFGYERSVRYVFFEQGGHVALCKRYRQYAQKIGFYVPFTEKIRRNPNLQQGFDLLIGAANIWNWEPDKVGLVRELQEAGIERILWSGGGDENEIRQMNETPNVLTSRYDIYQDIMDTSRFPELNGVHGDWVTEAWPNDINWSAPDGVWRKGWEVEPKDPNQPRIPCAIICDKQAIPYAEKRVGTELERKPYRARFLDTTVAAPWQECYHPDHPTTRTESKIWKMKLLALMGERFNLVCGSETGHEASVPFCDFYEGMESLGPYRVPESGRNMLDVWDDVPERVEKYQVGEAYRLPLWELVYHDCTVSYWYWGDYNNKLPKIWPNRDLFNALYGTPPMYMFRRNYWRENKDRFVESYKIAEPVSRATGYSEMTDHQILTEDRSVQKTVFANGVEVIVNFGSQSFQLPDGSVLESNAVRTNLTSER